MRSMTSSASTGQPKTQVYVSVTCLARISDKEFHLWEVEKYYPLNVFKKSGQWYHFRDFEGDEAWIHKLLVSNILTIITKKEKCNIRSGPGTGFSIAFTVEKGVPFKVIKYQGSWTYIEHADGDKGWIYNSLVW